MQTIYWFGLAVAGIWLFRLGLLLGLKARQRCLQTSPTIDGFNTQFPPEDSVQDSRPFCRTSSEVEDDVWPSLGW